MIETWEAKLKRLETMLDNEPDTLTDDDIGFLRSRISYLPKRLQDRLTPKKK